MSLRNSGGSAAAHRARRATAARRVSAAAIAGFAMLFVTGCGISIPTDPNGTLESVSGSTLRAGASPEATLVDTDAEQPQGSLVDLVEDFAASIDAHVEWTIASEESLVGDLEAGDLDLAVGGFTAQTPWSDRAGVTRGYSNIPGSDDRKVVVLVPLGENAFLSSLEKFLDERVGS